MKSKKKSIGIIGCGLIADTHVEAIKKILPNASISVCDPLPGKAELLKKKYGLKNSYTSLEKMLSREDLFSVHILSPAQLHVDHALKCLESGCHVLVEKPLTFFSRDVDILYDAAKKHDKVLCVDHSFFQQPSIVKMFKKLKSDGASQVLFVNSFIGLDLGGLPLSASLPENHWKWGLPGGPIMDNLIHPVTLAVELTGKPVEFAIHFIGPENNPEDVHISWKSKKAMASLTLSSRPQPFKRVTEVTTNKQNFIVDHSTETLVSLDSGFGPKAMRKLLRNFQYASQLTLGTIGTVVQVVRGSLKESPGIRGVVEAYYRHLIEGSEIPVSEENVRNSVDIFEKITVSLVGDRSKEIHEPQKLRHDSLGDASTTTLVTGASGYVGRHICEILSRRNRKIIAQVRRGPNSDKLQSSNMEKVFVDLNDQPVDYARLVDGVKEIIHCARAGAKTWEGIKKTNVDATVDLYEAAAKAGCEKFVFLSSVAVYGVHQKGRVTANEETPAILGQSEWDYYIRSKTMAEKLLLEKAKKGGPKLLIIRPGILYSADGTMLTRRSIPLKNSRLFISFGRGKNHSPFTRVDIFVETICKALDMDPFPEGIYNMTGNPEESTRDFIYGRMKKLGITCRFMTLPAPPFRFFASALERLYSVTLRKSPPKITRYIIDSSIRDVYYDCSKAERELGWDSKKAVSIL